MTPEACACAGFFLATMGVYARESCHMYCPAHFQASQPAALQALMAQYPLATIVHSVAQGLVADHIPLLFEAVEGRPGRLIGHVAKANPLWQTTAPVLVIFQGPDAYISPNWYPSKADNGKVVPTWNYAVVHVQAGLRAIHDTDELLHIVTRLTEVHEASQPQPWQVADAPADYTQHLLTQIVGVVLDIHNIQGKCKLSQNQPSTNQQGVVQGLQHTQQLAMLDYMQAHR